MYKENFSFLTYSLTKINYSNTNQNNTYFTIDLNDSFNSEDNVYVLNIRIGCDFSKDESEFIFQSKFKIINLEWFNNISQNDKRGTFLNIVFPFIREKLLLITTDDEFGLFIPVINFSNLDFSKQIRFNKVLK